MGRNKKTKTARRIARQIVQMHEDKATGKQGRKGPAPRAREKLGNITLAAVRKEFRKVWLEKSAVERAAHDAKVTALMAAAQPAYDVEARRDAEAEAEVEEILDEIEAEQVAQEVKEEIKAESARLPVVKLETDETPPS